jgi:hypothetical protein
MLTTGCRVDLSSQTANLEGRLGGSRFEHRRQYNGTVNYRIWLMLHPCISVDVSRIDRF